MIIDTHSHIFSDDFKGDVHEAIERAQSCGVEKILMPNIDSTTIQSMMKLSKVYPDYCLPMIGVHPTSIRKENYLTELEIVEENLKSAKFVGIGEIGIDLYWDKSCIDEQITVFKRQLELSKKYRLPVSIHIRDAFEETFNVLHEMQDGSLTGVLHCFSGTYEQAIDAMNMGFYIGVGGIVTFKNAGIDQVISRLPMESLVVETDTPYLAPTPFRGKQNETSYILKIIEKIADLHQISSATCAQITTANAKKVFQLDSVAI